jgi:hypothetical protein
MTGNQSRRQLNGSLDYWYDAHCPTNRISYLMQLSFSNEAVLLHQHYEQTLPVKQKLFW